MYIILEQLLRFEGNLFNFSLKIKMMKNVIFPILFILAFSLIVACSSGGIEKKEDISNVPLSDLPDMTGLTQKEQQKHMDLFRSRVNDSTVNRTIPKTMVFSKDWKPIELTSLLTKPSIIVSSSLHCGAGLIGTFEDFPKAIKQLKTQLAKHKTIVLLQYSIDDSLNQEFLNQNIQLLGSNYDEVVLIKDSLAFNLNLYSNPIRLYVNKHKVVTQLATGMFIEEHQLIAEMKEGIAETN